METKGLKKGNYLKGHEYEYYIINNIFYNEKGESIFEIYNPHSSIDTIRFVKGKDIESFDLDTESVFEVGDLVTFASSRFHYLPMIVVDKARSDFDSYFYIIKPRDMERGVNWVRVAEKEIRRFVDKGIFVTDSREIEDLLVGK